MYNSCTFAEVLKTVTPLKVNKKYGLPAHGITAQGNGHIAPLIYNLGMR